MDYEWVATKAKASSLKHGVAFETVEEFDWSAATVPEGRRREYGERRFIAVGPIGERLHVLIFTLRGGTICLSRLRKANARERLCHERS